MIEIRMMITGLKRQSLLLDQLIQELERKPLMNEQDFLLYGQRTRLVAKNLKKLRQIKDTYFIDQHFLTVQ